MSRFTLHVGQSIEFLNVEGVPAGHRVAVVDRPIQDSSGWPLVEDWVASGACRIVDSRPDDWRVDPHGVNDFEMMVREMEAEHE